MNQLHGKKFVSVFKIDGVHLPPPLITSNKRKLIQSYREKAILIENTLLSRKHTAELALSEEGEQESEPNFEEDFLKISSFLQSKVQLNSINKKTSPIQDLQKSDTLIYDVISNTVIIPYESNNTETFSNLNEILQQNFKRNAHRIADAFLTKSTDILNTRSNQIMPAVIVKPPTPDTDSILCLPITKSDVIFETRHNIQSNPLPSEDDKTVKAHSSLIRTNSFVLEKASNVLVEHMDKLAIKDQQELSVPQNITNKKKGMSSFSMNKSPKAIAYKKKGISNMYDQADIKKENIFTNTTLFKNKKSPYELEISRKNKISKKHKTPILKTSSNITLKTKSSNSTNHKNRLNENENVYYTKIFEDIEKQHQLQLVELAKKHQDEQNKMKESFEYKQKLLLEHLSSPRNSSTLDNLNYSIDQIEQLNSEKNHFSNKFCTNNITSRLYNNKAENKNILKETIINNVPGSTERREVAATIINKYVRGYLTRRIFNTLYVQRIVMIIQDTLLFVLNLHNHTNGNDNPENIKLKVRLLQQLKTSCYNLHNVFFELSTKQQMTLISKDRIYKINNKL